MARAAEEKQVTETQKDQQLQEKLQDITHEQELGGEGDDGKDQNVRRPLPPEPRIQYEPPPEPPNEPSGVGINKKVTVWKVLLQPL